jgi:ABC-type transport system involved in multi-copper enzyme maturation permease subunit
MEQEKTMARAAYDELVRDNAMTDEAIRYFRKMWRGNNQGGVIANIVVVSLAALMYVYVMIAMIKWNWSFTVPIEYVELVAVTLIAPAAIYAAISGEREKATWDALVLTRLTAAQIIAGKLLWRLVTLAGVMALFVVMILVSQSQATGHDGPAAAAVFLTQCLIFAWGLLLSTFGLWISARTARSVTSIGIIIGAMLGALAMLPALLSAFGATLSPERAETALDYFGAAVVSVNPFILVSEVADWAAGGQYRMLSDPRWTLMVACLYLAAAALLVWLTRNTLKRLSAE